MIFKQNKLVIGLIGEKGSGKGTVAKYLIEKYGAVHYGTSKILRRTIEDLRLPVTRDNLIKLALVLKEGFWPSVVIEALIAEIDESPAEIVIADGIRMYGDVEPFWDKYGENFKLIYVTAPLELRYERTKTRKEKSGEDKMTFQEFLEEEGRLTEVSIHEIGKKADYKIANSLDEKHLFSQIRQIMDNILKS